MERLVYDCRRVFDADLDPPIMAIDGVQFPAEHPRLKVLSKQYTDIPPEPL